ncbi:MAG: hypothetical protein ACRCVG_03890, partial [Methanobacteriaceae archaeon]
KRKRKNFRKKFTRLPKRLPNKISKYQSPNQICKPKKEKNMTFGQDSNNKKKNKVAPRTGFEPARS